MHSISRKCVWGELLLYTCGTDSFPHNCDCWWYVLHVTAMHIFQLLFKVQCTPMKSFEGVVNKLLKKVALVHIIIVCVCVCVCNIYRDSGTSSASKQNGFKHQKSLTVAYLQGSPKRRNMGSSREMEQQIIAQQLFRQVIIYLVLWLKIDVWRCWKHSCGCCLLVSGTATLWSWPAHGAGCTLHHQPTFFCSSLERAFGYAPGS